MSKESLDFLADMGNEYRLLRPIFANRERYCRDLHGFELNYKASYWTPPLPPHLAFDLERRQIEDHLQLPALVSITTIRHSGTSILALDSPCQPDPNFRRVDRALQGLALSSRYTQSTRCNGDSMDAYVRRVHGCARLKEILSELHTLPNTLIVFNHP